MARRIQRVVGLGVGVVLVATVVLTAMVLVSRRAGPPVRVVSAEGGFSLQVSKSWRTELRHPDGKKVTAFVVGHENAVFGLFRRGGFWVTRWPAEDDRLSGLEARLQRENAASPRDNWSVRRTRVGDIDAVQYSFTESNGFEERLRLGQRRTVIYEFLVRSHRYQVGLWMLPRAGDVPKRLDAIAQSIEVFAPQSWVARISGGPRLTLPGGWAERPNDLPGAELFALAPGTPAPGWVYVFRYPGAPMASLDAARRNIPRGGGSIVAERPDRLGGRAATRLDFTFADEGFAPARGTEWFVADGRGGTFVLAVALRTADPALVDEIARGWRF